MSATGHGPEQNAAWVTREGLTPAHGFAHADTALPQALADWLFGAAPSSVPATAPVTGQVFALGLGDGIASGWASAPATAQTLALTEAPAAARGGAVALVTGLGAALTLGTVTAGADEPPVPVPTPGSGGLIGVGPRPRLTRDELAALFPDAPVVAGRATVSPLRLTLALAPVAARGHADVAGDGAVLQLSLGPVRAHAVHNPTDEELLVWLAAA